MHVQTAFITHSDQRELSLDQEFFVLSNIKRETMQIEKELFSTKWFDYRFMTPFEATMQYVDDFAEVGRWIYQREFDRARADHIHFSTSLSYMRYASGVGPEMAQKEKAKFTGYWKGRQIADAIGMPYKLYIEHALTLRMRAWQRTYLPAPFQIYRDEDVIRVNEKWEELQASRNFYAEHHAYMAQNYIGLPAQNDYHEYLFRRVGERSDKLERLAWFVNENMIPLDKVRARLTEPDFERLSDYLH